MHRQPVLPSSVAINTSTRRKFLVQSASALGLALGATRMARAAAGVWSQDQGGSRDHQTGLVWLDFTLVSGWIEGYQDNFTEAALYPFIPNTTFTNDYSDWRVPTLDEMITACADGLALNCPLAGTPNVHFLWWSSKSRAGGKQAAAMDLRTGVSQWVIVKDSGLCAMFVRQGTL